MAVAERVVAARKVDAFHFVGIGEHLAEEGIDGNDAAEAVALQKQHGDGEEAVVSKRAVLAQEKQLCGVQPHTLSTFSLFTRFTKSTWVQNEVGDE